MLCQKFESDSTFGTSYVVLVNPFSKRASPSGCREQRAIADRGGPSNIPFELYFNSAKNSPILEI